MRKLGIAAKLYLAFGAIFLMAVIASSIGWQGFERVTESQNSVIDQAIPGLRQAHRLSALNASIGAAAAQLLRAGDELERSRISNRLFSQVDEVNSLLDEFRQKEFSPGSLQALRRTVSDIETKLHRQDELVRQRIRQQSHFTELLTELIATTEALNDLADSLVANAAATTTAITSNLYDLVEDDADKQQLFDVFDRLVEVDLDAMERMYELRLRSANLNGLFNRVSKASEAEELELLRARTAETLSILKRRISEINDPQRQSKAGQLLAAMEFDNGPLYVYGIFETRISLLEIEDSLYRLALETAEASQTLNRIVDDLNATGGRLINRVSTTAKKSLDNSQRLFGVTSVVLLIVAVAILWWFIKRNVVRRLLSLQSATRSITRGDFDVDIRIEGHDELTDMATALRGFRNNAIDKRKLDEELRRHKVDLEELVEQRSKQLKETNQMLSEEVRNHALAREKAEQANQAKTAFLATMSHELRTPLSGALGTLRLLSETELSEKQADYVNIVNTANTSLLDIVNDILGYSQLEAGKLHIEQKRYDLTELVNNVVSLMQVSVGDKNNQLRLEMEDRTPHWLYGDSGKLHQILINLIGNANKFTDNGNIILRVSTKPHRQQDKEIMRFTVIDSGIGIAEDRQVEIFQAFTQVDTSSARRYGGIGLGLAICERLVNAMGGKIFLESAPGEGTTIGFSIDSMICRDRPVSEVIAHGDDVAAEAIQVLMVEDDATNRMVTSHYLQHIGHRVMTAVDGEQAIELLDKGGMSLVLLDISLPGIDGLEILSYIRHHSDPAIAALPVIAMSAHVYDEEVSQYLGAGMNGFLGKPFSMEDLDHAINRAVSGEEIIITNTSETGLPTADRILDNSVVDDDIVRLGRTSVNKLAILFFQSGEALKRELIEAIEQHDPDRAARLAHRLNGAAGNFGLQKLCAILGAIESQALGGLGTSDEALDQFRNAYATAIRTLAAYLDRDNESSELLSASS